MKTLLMLVAAGAVAVRDRTEGDKGQMTLEAFIEQVQAEVRNRPMKAT